MSAPNETPAQNLIGDFAPKMVSLTDDVLFGDVWERAELAPRDRSLITVAALIANGNAEQLPGHLALARQNGLTETELKEVIIHLVGGGAEPLAPCTNTMHKVADAITAAVDVRFVHNADTTAAAVRSHGLETSGLLASVRVVELAVDSCAPPDQLAELERAAHGR